MYGQYGLCNMDDVLDYLFVGIYLHTMALTM